MFDGIARGLAAVAVKANNRQLAAWVLGMSRDPLARALAAQVIRQTPLTGKLLLWGDESGALLLWGDESGNLLLWGYA